MRAAERTLEVLAAVNKTGPGTLLDLHLATGLPRPSLLRVLQTLMAMGYVRRGLSDSKYRVTSKTLLLAQTLTPEDHLAEIATPFLDRLCDELRWPSDLAVLDTTTGDCMRIVETSLRRSKFYLRRRATGARVNVLASAVGIAYLSAVDASTCRTIVQAARSGDDLHNLNSIASGDWRRQIELARRQHYAFRAEGFRGGDYRDAPIDDGLDALAVPLVLDGMVAAVNLTWNRKAASRKDMRQKGLSALKAVIADITNAWASNIRLLKPPGFRG